MNSDTEFMDSRISPNSSQAYYEPTYMNKSRSQLVPDNGSFNQTPLNNQDDRSLEAMQYFSNKSSIEKTIPDVKEDLV